MELFCEHITPSMLGENRNTIKTLQSPKCLQHGHNKNRKSLIQDLPDQEGSKRHNNKYDIKQHKNAYIVAYNQTNITETTSNTTIFKAIRQKVPSIQSVKLYSIH